MSRNLKLIELKKKNIIINSEQLYVFSFKTFFEFPSQAEKFKTNLRNRTQAMRQRRLC